MALEAITIPGVTGEITTKPSFRSGFTFTVGGQRVKPHGFPRNRLTLPGTAGPVEAKVKGGLLRAHPTLVVGGVEYPTGEPTPRGLQVAALLPLLGFLLVQGALGILLAIGGVAVNMSIVRGEGSRVTKVGLMGAVFLVVIAIDVALVVALT